MRLRVRSKGKARRRLRKKGKAKVKAEVTYTPDGGEPITHEDKLKLQAPLTRAAARRSAPRIAPRCGPKLSEIDWAKHACARGPRSRR
ncbi:MAG TPA: hypothetical protein VK920_01480 [Solirubrobacterales bacterium]|nr:hypothetical protein [Solirubrobacterales bacterium]